MDDNYRRALESLRNLADDYEDVSMENEVLTDENKELEKDVEFIVDKHNDNVDALKKLASDTRAYRVSKYARKQRRDNDEYVEIEDEDDEYVYYEEKPKKVKKVVKKRKVVKQHEEEEFNFNKFMVDTLDKCNRIKWKLVFIIALIIVVLLAIGASPSNAISWKAFTDLYIEYICNPATMAMSVILVMLLYKGLVKRNTDKIK